MFILIFTSILKKLILTFVIGVLLLKDFELASLYLALSLSRRDCSSISDFLRFKSTKKLARAKYI